MRCRNCSKLVVIPSTNPSDPVDLNETAVLASVLIGHGYYAHQRIFSTLNVELFPNRRYYKIEKELHTKIEVVYNEIIDVAVNEEKRLSGEPGPDGCTLIAKAYRMDHRRTEVINRWAGLPP